MRIEVTHRTHFRFAGPSSLSMHQCRLTPMPGAGQRIVNWDIRVPGRPRDWIDGYGNTVRAFAVAGAHEEVEIVAHGVFEWPEGGGAFLSHDDPEPLPPLYWLRNHGLARHDQAIRDFVADLEPRAAAADARIELLHDLMKRISGRVKYAVGATDIEVGAGVALRRGAGVCQDHAHLFAACCRALGIPARYVSGYLRVHDELRGPASHAWAEAFVPSLGFVGFDPANGICPTGEYLKLAVGLDYREAAPVTGRRLGGGEARMEVEVEVRQVR
ncbi:MAG: transglutaminase family protein [Rhodospirillales bacterium]